MALEYDPAGHGTQAVVEVAPAVQVGRSNRSWSVAAWRREQRNATCNNQSVNFSSELMSKVFFLHAIEFNASQMNVIYT